MILYEHMFKLMQFDIKSEIYIEEYFRQVHTHTYI